jgi:hypothetical protein
MKKLTQFLSITAVVAVCASLLGGCFIETRTPYHPWHRPVVVYRHY